MKAPENELIEFSIDHLDPLGQGVSKSQERVTFIAKTLPGEVGIARVFKKSKGVQFAELIELSKPSPTRETPLCQHYSQCPGCHYLHTSHNNEIEFKKKSLLKLFQNLDLHPELVETRSNKSRFFYRNRIQLHYRDNKYGLIDAKSNQIIEIPECIIFEKALKPKYDKLYHTKKRPLREPKNGHVEIYYKNQETKLSWNSAYADGGFTQVNDGMNSVLKKEVTQILEKANLTTVLDLFSGDGNLSQATSHTPIKRTLVDISVCKPDLKDIYHQLNLFKLTSLESFKTNCKITNFDLMIVDPPRKGFPFFKEWVDHYKPQKIIYISCKAATMARDLKEIKESYSIKKALMLDLFPGSFHFETMVYLEKLT